MYYRSSSTIIVSIQTRYRLFQSCTSTQVWVPSASTSPLQTIHADQAWKLCVCGLWCNANGDCSLCGGMDMADWILWLILGKFVLVGALEVTFWNANTDPEWCGSTFLHVSYATYSGWRMDWFSKLSKIFVKLIESGLVSSIPVRQWGCFMFGEVRMLS